ncbi:MAG: hypothetical protein HGB14_10470 [Anaerolineaceae bacterium]|nr:hypothetical protein [Anaerolineaceae bacterium]
MKILIIVGITLLLLVIVIGTLLWLSSRPITKDRATSEIQRIIEGSLNDKKSITNY